MSTSAEDADAEFHNSAEYLGALKILENAIRSRRLRRLWPDMEKLQSRYMDQAALAAGAGSNPLYSNFALAVREGLRFAPEVQQALSHAWLVCTSAAGTTAAPSGTRWTNAGTKQPPHAVQLTNPSLESALGQGHLDFTSAQLQNFGVPPLRPDHYVKAGEAYFMPAATLPRDDYEAMTRKLYLAIMLDDEDVGVDPLDCAATRDNDWAEDSEGKEELTEAAFHKAWFQVRRPAHTVPRPRRAPSAPCPARAVGLPSVWLQRTGTAGAGRCMHCACACERAYAYAPVRAPVRAPVACAAAATGSRRIALAPPAFVPSGLSREGQPAPSACAARGHEHGRARCTRVRILDLSNGHGDHEAGWVRGRGDARQRPLCRRPIDVAVGQRAARGAPSGWTRAQGQVCRHRSKVEEALPRRGGEPACVPAPRGESACMRGRGDCMMPQSGRVHA